VQERPDIFGEWEEALDEMRRTLDRIEDRREQPAQEAGQEDKRPDES
jgi:hypothetical protein